MLFHSLPVSLAFLRKNWDRCKIFILQRPLFFCICYTDVIASQAPSSDSSPSTLIVFSRNCP